MADLRAQPRDLRKYGRNGYRLSTATIFVGRYQTYFSHRSCRNQETWGSMKTNTAEIYIHPPESGQGSLTALWWMDIYLRSVSFHAPPRFLITTGTVRKISLISSHKDCRCR